MPVKIDKGSEKQMQKLKHHQSFCFRRPKFIFQSPSFPTSLPFPYSLSSTEKMENRELWPVHICYLWCHSLLTLSPYSSMGPHYGPQSFSKYSPGPLWSPLQPVRICLLQCLKHLLPLLLLWPWCSWSCFMLSGFTISSVREVSFAHSQIHFHRGTTNTPQLCPAVGSLQSAGHTSCVWYGADPGLYSQGWSLKPSPNIVLYAAQKSTTGYRYLFNIKFTIKCSKLEVPTQEICIYKFSMAIWTDTCHS